jgi:hypothetical protein
MRAAARFLSAAPRPRRFALLDPTQPASLVASPVPLPQEVAVQPLSQPGTAPAAAPPADPTEALAGPENDVSPLAVAAAAAAVKVLSEPVLLRRLADRAPLVRVRAGVERAWGGAEQPVMLCIWACVAFRRAPSKRHPLPALPSSPLPNPGGARGAARGPFGAAGAVEHRAGGRAREPREGGRARAALPPRPSGRGRAAALVPRSHFPVTQERLSGLEGLRYRYDAARRDLMATYKAAAAADERTGGGGSQHPAAAHAALRKAETEAEREPAARCARPSLLASLRIS